MFLLHTTSVIFFIMAVAPHKTQHTKSHKLAKRSVIPSRAWVFLKQLIMILLLQTTAQDLVLLQNTLQFPRKKPHWMSLAWLLLQRKFLYLKSWVDIAVGLQRQRV